MYKDDKVEDQLKQALIVFVSNWLVKYCQVTTHCPRNGVSYNEGKSIEFELLCRLHKTQTIQAKHTN